jgi:predicted dehydrogenase
MSSTYRVGAIGFAHGHIHTAIGEFAKLPNIEWVACADTVPAVPSIYRVPGQNRGVQRFQNATGNTKVYADYREMLDKEKFDIIIFCPENAHHAEVAEAIASKGIHMVTEKPMADSLSDALRMVRACKANHVELMVNWPTTWSPAVRTMKALIDKGVIGDIWEIKWRNGGSMGPMSYSEPQPPDAVKGAEWWHQSAPGGGAFLDYCCYGACLARWYIGQPAVAALGMKTNLTSHYGGAEDNAVITVRFPKAMALLEATWTTWNSGIPTGPIVYGTRGTLVATSRPGADSGRAVPVVEVFTSRGHGGEKPDQVVEGDPLPKGRATLAEEFIHHLETGDPLHPTLEMMQNLDAMAILDAGIRSAASGKIELVNDAYWCIG